MKKSTNHDTRLVPLTTIISYSTILYHMIVESQSVINVVLILIKMLYKNSIKLYKYSIYTNRYFNRFYVIDRYM